MHIRSKPLGGVVVHEALGFGKHAYALVARVARVDEGRVQVERAQLVGGVVTGVGDVG